jgi:hypothetical protein
MRKIFTLLLITASCSLTAQIQKGTKLVGASIGGVNYSFTGGGVFSVSLYPSVTKFYTDRFAFGGSANIGLVIGSGTAVFSTGISPLARLYNKSDGMDRCFVQAFAGVNTHISGDPLVFFNYGAGVGYNRFFTQNLALELGLNYSGFSGEGAGIHNLGVGLGFQIFLAPGVKPFRKTRKG